MISWRWQEYQPPSLCGFDFGIGEALALGGLSAAAEAGTAAAVGTAAAGTTAALGTGGLFAAEAAGAGAAAASGGLGLGTLGSVLSLGGTLLQAKGQGDNAAYQAAVARNEAEALRMKGNEDAAVAERKQIDAERQTALTTSRLRALGASSGTDATSPDIINTEQGIIEQGQYNALSALYEGQARSRADNYQATIDLYKARQIQAAAGPAMFGTILSGASSFVDRRLRRNYLLDSGGGGII